MINRNESRLIAQDRRNQANRTARQLAKRLKSVAPRRALKT